MSANEVRLLRIGLYMTQGELGQSVGVDRVTVTRWENGSRGISAAYAQTIREVVERLGAMAPDMRTERRLGVSPSGTDGAKTGPYPTKGSSIAVRKPRPSNKIPA